MKHASQRLSNWWGARPPRSRLLLSTVLVVLGVALLASAWGWQKVERPRLTGRVAVAEAQVKRMQDDVAEVQRLRARAMPPAVEGQTLINTVTASLQGRKLNLNVTALGPDRLRIQGNTGFDEAVAWLGSIQRDYRLYVITLSATRQDGNAQLEAVLATAKP